MQKEKKHTNKKRKDALKTFVNQKRTTKFRRIQGASRRGGGGGVKRRRNTTPAEITETSTRIK